MKTERPNIQIDDLVRPMTDEEYANLLKLQELSQTPLSEGGFALPKVDE
jgi:hypothetical protein